MQKASKSVNDVIVIDTAADLSVDDRRSEIESRMLLWRHSVIS